MVLFRRSLRRHRKLVINFMWRWGANFRKRNSEIFSCRNLSNPVSVYGKTKLVGEDAIRRAGIPHLIFRTAWLYATRGRNFMLTILRLATEKEELRIVRDQIGVPTWSREIAARTAKVLSHVIERSNGASSFSGVSGTYHMAAAGETTWYDFARAILEEASSMPQGIPWFPSPKKSPGPRIARTASLPISLTTESFTPSF